MTGRDRWLALGAALLGWLFDGLEMGMFPLIARPALQQMAPAALAGGGDAFTGLWMGRITAAFLVGAALGGLVFGWLGDRIGRVRAMALSILTYSLFTGVICLAQTPVHLAAARFCAALGMGGEWSLGVALVMEIWPDHRRPLLAGIIGAAAQIGFILVGVAGLCLHITVHSWRAIAVVGIGPALLTFFFQRMVPESTVWLHASRGGEAAHPGEVFRPPWLGRTAVAVLVASVVFIGTWASVQWLPLWADQLTGGARPAAKAVTLIVSSLGALVGCLLGAWAGHRLGRRPAYAVLCVGSFLICRWLFGTQDAYGASFLAGTFLAGGITSAFFGWLPLYLPELFPARIRATGQGLAYNAGKVVAAFGAVGTGQWVAAFHGSYARVGAAMAFVYLAGLPIILLAPETKGKALPA